MSIDHPPDALYPGSRLGDFEIQRVLGQGGFGITYAARGHAESGQLVAIKELFPAGICSRENSGHVVSREKTSEDIRRDLTGMFLREAEIICKLRHSNIVQGINSFQDNGTGYLVMKYVSGNNLYELLRNRDGGFDVSQESMFALLSPLMSALRELHKHNILHGDIKPDNIFMGVGYQPILIDLGSARLRDSTLDWEGAATYYPHFAAIEQYTSRFGMLGPWTDIYQLSAVAYRCIAGGKIPDAIERAKLKDDPYLPLRDSVGIRDSYPSCMLKAIDAGLNIYPKERPGSVDEWARAMGVNLDKKSLSEVSRDVPVQSSARFVTDRGEQDYDKVEQDYTSGDNLPAQHKTDPLLVVGVLLVVVIFIVALLLVFLS